VKCRRFTILDAKRAAKHLHVRVRPEVLLVGMNVEREHQDVTRCSPTQSARIALAHLRERRDYYARLLRYVER
jgi:hypothetical protein